MNNPSGEQEDTPTASEGSSIQSDRPIVYGGRGAQVDLHLELVRDDALLTIRGRLVPRTRRAQTVAGVTVELFSPAGLVASTTTGRAGTFEFGGLARGLYHLRMAGDGWKLSVLGITG